MSSAEDPAAALAVGRKVDGGRLVGVPGMEGSSQNLVGG